MTASIFRRLRAGTAAIGAVLVMAGVIAGPPANALTFKLPPPGDDMVGHIHVVVATRQDTLPDIARRYDVGYDEIRAANPGVDVWLPGAGTRVVVPTRYILPKPWKGIIVNLAALRLFYFPKQTANQPGEVLTFPVGIGRGGWATPLGITHVVDRIVNPSWTPPPSIRREHKKLGEPPLPPVVPGGPGNPLGLFALQLGLPGYLIHGTNKPYGVGMRVSHGCIRLYPRNIKALFKVVPVGTPVRIVDQPELIGWNGRRVYVQSYPDWVKKVTIARRLQLLHKMARREVARVPGREMDSIDWADVRNALMRSQGLPVEVSGGIREASVARPHR